MRGSIWSVLKSYCNFFNYFALKYGAQLSKLTNKNPCIPEQSHPWRVLSPVIWMPAHLYRTEYSLGVRHHDGIPTIWCRNTCNTIRRAIWIMWITRCDITIGFAILHHDLFTLLQCKQLFFGIKYGPTFSMRNDNWRHRINHSPGKH